MLIFLYARNFFLDFVMGVIKFLGSSGTGDEYEVITGLLLNYVKVQKSSLNFQVTCT
jgi:hypothetical protein